MNPASKLWTWRDSSLLVASLVVCVVIALSKEVTGNGIELTPKELRRVGLDEGDVVTMVFTVKNRGRSPARIRIKTSCSCSTAVKDIMSLLPGQESTVPVRVDTGAAPGYNIALVEARADTGEVDTARLVFQSIPRAIVSPRFQQTEDSSRTCQVDVFCVGAAVPKAIETCVSARCWEVRCVRVNRRRWRLQVHKKKAGSGRVIVTIRDGETNKRLGAAQVVYRDRVLGELRCGPRVAAGKRWTRWLGVDEGTSIERVQGEGVSVEARVSDSMNWVLVGGEAGQRLRVTVALRDGAGSIHSCEVEL